MISTKSQFHQVPQFNSCSAHQEPKIIAIKIKYIEFIIINNIFLKKNKKLLIINGFLLDVDIYLNIESHNLKKYKINK